MCASVVMKEETEGEDIFPFTRKMVYSLKKHNMCIQPIPSKATSNSKSRVAEKKMSREISCTLKFWEREGEEAESSLGKGQGSSLLR